jgi:hypothetical protein
VEWAAEPPVQPEYNCGGGTRAAGTRPGGIRGGTEGAEPEGRGGTYEAELEGRNPRGGIRAGWEASGVFWPVSLLIEGSQ